MMEYDIRIPFTRIRIGRFLFLLLSILFLFVLRPFLTGYIGLSLLTNIFATVILVSAAYAAAQKKRLFIPALMLAILAIIIRWMDYLIQYTPLALLEEVFTLLFYGYMVAIILSYLFKEQEVTADLIIGSICGYFLLGLMWGSLYSLLELLHVGSFQIPDIMGKDMFALNYYSFVTLTTLGYGDITPLSQSARSFSVLQAVAGQLYIAILVARLVGIHIVQSKK